MTDNRRSAYIQGLRDFADFLDSHSSIPAPTYTRVDVYVRTRSEIAEIARMGDWEKKYYGSLFALRKTFCKDFSFDVNVDREQICEKVVTGTRVVPAYPATEESVEEVFEWVCSDSLFSDKD